MSGAAAGPAASGATARKQDFLTLAELSPTDLTALLDGAAQHKARRGRCDVLAGRSVALLFERPSTRTRVAFELAVEELGGYPLLLPGADQQLGRRETVEDTAAVLSRFVHAIVVRTFAQDTLERMARAANVPVINGLTNFAHPCQVLADLLTVRERKGRLAGVRLGYLGDGNNIAHSLLLGGALAGLDVTIATPHGYEPIPLVVRQATELAAGTGGRVTVTNDPGVPAAGADVLYTDVWASLGQEEEHAERALIFQPFQLGASALAAAAPDAIVLHGLPAQRGEEITAEALDGPKSAVLDQAANALHTNKALLCWLLTGSPWPT